jgi:hypothetical protein
MRRRRLSCFSISYLALAILLAICTVQAQQTTTTASPNPAASLVSLAQAALTGGVPVSDVVLTGTANLPKGKEVVNGTVTLKLKGTHYARLDIASGSDSRSEVRSDVLGEWIGGDGEPHRMASQNSLGPAAWFSPLAVISAMTEPNVIITYIGKETRTGINVEHLQYRRTFPKGPTRLSPEVEKRLPDLSKFSKVDVFLRADSYVPVAIEFNLHPDNDSRRNVPAEVRYADYRLVNGVRVPFRVQRLVLNQLDMDLSLESASINSGVSDSDFSLRSSVR